MAGSDAWYLSDEEEEEESISRDVVAADSEGDENEEGGDVPLVPGKE